MAPLIITRVSKISLSMRGNTPCLKDGWQNPAVLGAMWIDRGSHPAIRSFPLPPVAPGDGCGGENPPRAWPPLLGVVDKPRVPLLVLLFLSLSCVGGDGPAAALPDGSLLDGDFVEATFGDLADSGDPDGAAALLLLPPPSDALVPGAASSSTGDRYDNDDSDGPP